jgi:polysaccharide pyruvyl transferase WcaK-like protein
MRTILLFKTGARNFGDLLMAKAVSVEARKRGYDVALDRRTDRPAMERGTGEKFGVVPERFYRRYPHTSNLANSVAYRIGGGPGSATPSRIERVFDISGLSYSTHWSLGSVTELRDRSAWWARKGRRIMLLPQAFGPFDDTRVRAMRQALDHVDQIWARDPHSAMLMQGIVGNDRNVSIAPDFTGSITPEQTEPHDDESLCIVPNVRMLDKATDGADYIRFVRWVAAEGARRGLRIKWLLHSPREDARILDFVGGLSDAAVLRPQTPLEAKALLGAMGAVVSSRYHALVSALSMGTPAVAVGWMHKYHALMHDYGVPELAADGEDRWAAARSVTEHLMSDMQWRSSVRRTLAGNRCVIDARVQTMWDSVFGG